MATITPMIVHIFHTGDILNFSQSTPASRYTENQYPRSEVGLRQQIADALHLAAQHRQLAESIAEHHAECVRLANQLREMTAERDRLKITGPALEKRVETLETIARAYTVTCSPCM